MPEGWVWRVGVDPIFQRPSRRLEAVSVPGSPVSTLRSDTPAGRWGQKVPALKRRRHASDTLQLEVG